jgi:hypothetical protein
MTKSELAERISKHNPHLYRRDCERIVNVILAKSLQQWSTAIASNCAALERSRSESAQLEMDAIQEMVPLSRSLRRNCHTSNPARKCVSALTSYRKDS